MRKADGTYGVVKYVKTVQETRTMYNLDVAVADTFFVGTQGWLVHNCDVSLRQASEGAFDAAKNLGTYDKVKHLATTGGK
nr:hypothetical protein [Deinococcus peraridilitoris]